MVLILFLVDACKICKEHIRWICSRCNKSEDVTHKHRESVDDIIAKNATSFYNIPIEENTKYNFANTYQKLRQVKNDVYKKIPPKIVDSMAMYKQSIKTNSSFLLNFKGKILNMSKFPDSLLQKLNFFI